MISTRHRSKAFTLIELVLVLVILSIVAGMIVPSLQGFMHGRNISNTSSQIVALCHWSRTQAVANGKVYRLNFDTSGRTYFVTVQENGVFQDVGEEIGRRYTLPDEVSLALDAPQLPDGQKDAIEFNPTGRVSTATIRLTDRSGETVDIGALSATELFHVLTPEEQQAKHAQAR